MIFFKHTAIYGVGRLLPAALSLCFIALLIVTIDPPEYARFSAMFASASIILSAFFWWIRISAVRFLPELESPVSLIITSVVAHCLLLGAFGVLCIVTVGFVGENMKLTVMLVFFLIATRSIFDLTTELARALLHPWSFTIGSIVRPCMAIGVFMLPFAAKNGSSALIGLSIGAAAGAVIPVWMLWRNLVDALARWIRRPYIATRDAWRSVDVWGLLRFGMPVAAVFTVQSFLSGSDRIILVMFGDDLTAGYYSAAFDASLGIVGAASTIIYLAGYPLLMRMANGVASTSSPDLDAVRIYQLAWHSVVFPTAISTSLVAIFLYQMDLPQLARWNGALPYVPVAVLVMVFLHFRTHVLDVYYHKACKVLGLVHVGAWIVAGNLLGSILVVQQFGAPGVAGVTLMASLAFVFVTFSNSAWRALHLREFRHALVPAIVTIAVTTVLWPIADEGVLWMLVVAFVAGGAYGGTAVWRWLPQRRRAGTAFEESSADD